MFNLRDFVKSGLWAAIGKMEDYQIILNAAGWYEKGVLWESDLAELHEAIAPAAEGVEDSVLFE